jgi:hypothetical protein
VTLTAERGPMVSHLLSAAFFALALVFVWRSFYGMRIKAEAAAPAPQPARRPAH